jgi:hypothetical protein
MPVEPCALWKVLLTLSPLSSFATTPVIILRETESEDERERERKREREAKIQCFGRMVVK